MFSESRKTEENAAEQGEIEMISELVSVIVPSYRREQELYRALLSLSDQTYTNFEIVVIDDNADQQWNARVAAVIDRFSHEFPAISLNYIQNKTNCGSAETRNVGIRACKGSYICFLDDDDVYLPDRIEHQLRQMVETQADFSITDLILYDENERLVETRKRDYIQDESKLFVYHMMHHITGTDTIMFKTSYLHQLNCFDPIDIGDEFYLMAKAFRAGGVFLYAPGCHVKAYVHESEDGLSGGQRKIAGEKQLFAYKQKFFREFDRRTRNYIRMRHHAVQAYVYLRMGKYGMFLREGVHAVLTSPTAAVKLLCGRRC